MDSALNVIVNTEEHLFLLKGECAYAQAEIAGSDVDH